MSKTNQHPPGLARKVLRSFLREDLAEEVEGDLEEKFYSDLPGKLQFRAGLNYWYQVLNYLRPFAIKRFSSISHNYLTMYRHNIKISWRSLNKHRIFSLIKIGSLATGISASLLIGLYIKYSLSFDKHYPDEDQLYRVIGSYDSAGTLRSSYYPAALAGFLKKDFPEVEISGRMIGNELVGLGGTMVKRTGEVKNIYEKGFVFTDQGLLDILKPVFIGGDPSRVLSEPCSMVISKSKAEKFFPGENPVGQSLILNNDDKTPYIIKGVFNDFPSTSFFRYDFLLTLAGTEHWTGDINTWDKNIHQTFIKIVKGTNIASLESKITGAIARTYMLTSMRNAGMINADEIIRNFSFKLQPVKDIYLRSAGINDGLNHGDIRIIWIFGSVAFFIIIIACINFINLSTARSTNRAKEVGLRKVAGSLRRDLVSQFLVESVMFSSLAVILSLFISMVLLPYFNRITAISLGLPWKEWWLFPMLFSISIIIGILAGLYPAFYLSGFRPIIMLQGVGAQGRTRSGIRSILVIFQFTTSFILIIGTFIISRQLNYFLSRDLGFIKEQVLQINGTDVLKNQLPVFKRELQQLPGISSVSISNFLPVEGAKRNGNMFWKEGRKEVDRPVEGQIWDVDNDYIKTMGMRIIYGRDFDPGMASDSLSVIINQSMARALGIMNNPMGQQIVTTWRTMKVIGVVGDFNFEPMTKNIRPLCLVMGPGPSVVSVRYNISDKAAVINSINELWGQFCPNDPIRYSFLEEDFNNMYSDVKRSGLLIMGFSVLAVIIACLGLFALSSYNVEQRRKEVGIRLVMGASLRSIYRLLTRDFLVLILISLLLAIPAAWYLMNIWLENYAYRITITWDVFLIAGLMGTVIAILTISSQTVRAAYGNPVENLKQAD